ncbi:MAG: NADH-quinone oxidoreductase subunit C [Actinobacteria bacterium]|nr:NADH-quinone oxidoreductase subunit C [Thermoleophilia bacterium]MCB9010996.1 NADH-quinone oxidoreductase subunit C [Actinomycetota bacterium]
MNELHTLIEAACPRAVVEAIDGPGDELTLEIEAARIVEVARFLKGEPGSFVLLSDLTCADFLEGNGRGGRFRLAYHLFSLESGSRVRLRVWADAENPEVDSVTPVWATANWHEREVYDMFGVRFRNHPDMSRILMPFDWEGHPLRRDYPIGGEDVRFTEAV